MDIFIQLSKINQQCACQTRAKDLEPNEKMLFGRSVVVARVLLTLVIEITRNVMLMKNKLTVARGLGRLLQLVTVIIFP